ncbi:MAG TPA: Uma2 family endonuclease [Cyclobacteriaceae bacterium]
MKNAQTKIDYSSTAMRVWKTVPEDVMAEVMRNKLYVSDPPTIYHANASIHIGSSLLIYVEGMKLGAVYCAPVGVFLTGGTQVVMPDVVFVSNNSQVVITRKGIHGAPDLLIEILSPSTRRRDLTMKKGVYEEAGVKEYWLVDPETKNTQGYFLESKRYGEPLLMNSELYIRTLNKTINF